MGSWNDIKKIEEELKGALGEFDWTGVSEVCNQLEARIASTAQAFPLDAASRILQSLRRKRRFGEMKQIAEALDQSGQGGAEVMRQYSQGLIDSGELGPARRILEAIAANGDSPEKERYEAVGLLGRLYKQLYVNAKRPGDARQQQNLRTSLDWYWKGYQMNPAKNLWHAINVVALTARANRDGISAERFPDDSDLARIILKSAQGSEDPWTRAIRMEAHVALQEWPEAYNEALLYVGDDPDSSIDAFELASTLRQIEELWGLTSQNDDQARLLNVLRTELAKRIGGEVVLSVKDIGARRQANFDGEGRIPLEWWRKGLDRCDSIARIKTTSGKKVGSGFLVDPAFFLGPDSGVTSPVLLTNWHVVSKDGTVPGSVAPELGCAHFEASGQTVALDKIIGHNEALDACLVSLAPMEKALACCPLSPPPPVKYETKRRVYVIGYPGEGDLSFSIHDSYWLGMNQTLFHYRTPTEPGSSGSPVFDQDNWMVVALHHAGGKKVPRLHGSGTYEANEGISIEAIQQAISLNRHG